MKRLSHALGIAFASLVTLGVLASPPEEPKINECVDANGNIVYQDDPCPETPRLAVAASALPTPPQSDAIRPAPAVKRPKPGSARAVRPQEWFVIAPAHRTQLTSRAGGALHAASSHSAPPEETWRVFVAAIGAGDRAAAAACLTPSALARLESDASTLPVEKLREIVNTFTRVVVDGEVGPFWSIHASRPGLPPKWIFFERTERGEWKIAAI